MRHGTWQPSPFAEVNSSLIKNRVPPSFALSDVGRDAGDVKKPEEAKGVDQKTQAGENNSRSKVWDMIYCLLYSVSIVKPN